MRRVRHCAIVIDMNPNLIGTAEVARILGKSHRTVHRLVKSGDLVPVITAPGGLHGVFLFDPADVDGLLAGDAA